MQAGTNFNLSSWCAAWFACCAAISHRRQLLPADNVLINQRNVELGMNVTRLCFARTVVCHRLWLRTLHREKRQLHQSTSPIVQTSQRSRRSRLLSAPRAAAVQALAKRKMGKSSSPGTAYAQVQAHCCSRCPLRAAVSVLAFMCKPRRFQQIV